MPTPIASIISQARRYLHEPVEVTDGQWTDAELLDLVTNGVKDLARSMKDNYQNFFFTLDESNVTMPANSFTLTGVPADVFIVLVLEPLDLATYEHVLFVPKDYGHLDFRSARARSSVQVGELGAGSEIYFSITGAGGPVGSPTIYVAPKLGTAMPLRMAYVPTLTLGANNPVPGESDQALINWTVAYAKSKVREDQEPDPDWLALYSTEKTNILVGATPRQEVDIERVEGYLESEGDWWP